MEKEAKSLLEIIKSFLSETEGTVATDIDEKKLYQLAKANSVSNFLQKWAQKYCKSQAIKEKIDQDYSAQIVKDTNQEIEVEKLFYALEQHNIKTLVVKGVLMKDIYPQNYMRQMCDIDILVNSDDFKKATKMIENMGFHKLYNQEKHLIFTKPPFMMIELHRKLILKKDVVGYEYFKDVWPLCIQYKKYQNIYQLDRNHAYVFCILHLLTHFKFTGIKIKDVLDVYLYNETYKEDLNHEKLNEIFQDLGITDFAKNIKEISYKWFGEQSLDEFDEVEEFILKGTSSNNRVNYSIGKNNGKIKFLRELLFPNREVMQEKYPSLKKNPLLLPIMWITRIGKDVFSKGIPLKNRIHTLKLIKQANHEEIEKVKSIYHKLGIK